ncbi:MAG: hypothetical protein LBS15_03155 [Endomicrobium sp.]|nr:hypothetical protein [Endomicrobium sp.]
MAFIVDMSEGKGLNSFEWNSEGELVEVKENFVPKRVKYDYFKEIEDYKHKERIIDLKK